MSGRRMVWCIWSLVMCMSDVLGCETGRAVDRGAEWRRGAAGCEGRRGAGVGVMGE
jgi:hypothetical protein